MDKPIARWTIGDTNEQGYECLELSIRSFLKFHTADIVVAHSCDPEKLPKIDGVKMQLLDQRPFLDTSYIAPVGVAWKLYPPRLKIERHEICIDNDIIFQEPIEQLNKFFKSDCTLLLEGQSRNYGRFERYIPPKVKINSGIYGMPPNFDMDKFIKIVAGNAWELNAKGEHAGNKTFDEQGIVAFALLNYPRYVTIPEKVVTNCERHLIEGKGMHFVGLNKRFYHEPYRLYRSKVKRMFL
jgi:hypothetical protein